MLLKEIAQVKQPTFAALRLSGPSRAEIMKLSKGIEHRTQESAIHVTLIYSKKPIVLKGRGDLKPPMTAKAKQYSLFTTEGGNYCLVLELDAPDIVARHKAIMEETGASYDHPEYHPHITLSYDVGKDFDLNSLPPVTEVPVLYLVQEYAQKINPKWAETAEEV